MTWWAALLVALGSAAIGGLIGVVWVLTSFGRSMSRWF
jgi:hypothetical protein